MQEQAVGSDVLNGLNPGQTVIKIVNDEMVRLMGSETTEIALRPGSETTVIMMTGLQGAGKTTTTAKLAGKFKQKGKKPLLVACDVYRTAAIEQDVYKRQELLVPHLFIVVDEFAELKREQPEFMKELISVAQVGRSLGVHLILATQKPAGTVDENIWSNSKFKLCLRVQDKQDSKEMLHKEDAAFITQTGRGYLQVGNDELYELFQSGWSGAESVSYTHLVQALI